MKALVVGHGAREHAIAKSLASSKVEIVAAMATMNPGIADLSKCVEIMDINDPEKFNKFQGIDIAFIGPESALAAGITDRLLELEVQVVGPTKKAAKLEWSKAFAREFLDYHDIEGNPTFKVCRTLKDIRGFLKTHPNVAVKPDVLTGGKGVKLSGEHLHGSTEVEGYASERIMSDGLVVLEEKLRGNEFTLQAFTDGQCIEVMPMVRDFKRAYDNDKGPNTGSMGSYSCPDHSLPDVSKVAVHKGTEIMEKTVRKLADSVDEYRGILYGGFMDTREGVYLIEYNVRFGDPEAMNVLSLLDKPLIDVGWEIVEGKLSTTPFQKKATVCVYLVPTGYPLEPRRGVEVSIETPKKSELYFASVHEEDGVIYTTGSRSIALLAKGVSVPEAREKVYSDVTRITGELFHRTDIGAEI
jgi:phosphoribosylamine--glycine ligase